MYGTTIKILQTFLLIYNEHIMSFCAAIILLALTVYTLQSPISEKSLTDYGIKCLRITTHGRLEKYFKDETGLYWKEFKCKDKDVLYCDNVFSNQPRRRLFCQKECCPEFHPSTTMMPLISSGPATVSAAKVSRFGNDECLWFDDDDSRRQPTFDDENSQRQPTFDDNECL